MLGSSDALSYQRTSCCCCQSWMLYLRLMVKGWCLLSAKWFVCSSHIRPWGRSWTEGCCLSELKWVLLWRLGQAALSQMSESCNPVVYRPWEDRQDTQTHTWLMRQNKQSIVFTVQHIPDTDCNIRFTSTQVNTDCFNPTPCAYFMPLFIHDMGVAVTNPPAEEITWCFVCFTRIRLL